jgi:hypothetical protein
VLCGEAQLQEGDVVSPSTLIGSVGMMSDHRLKTEGAAIVPCPRSTHTGKSCRLSLVVDANGCLHTDDSQRLSRPGHHKPSRGDRVTSMFMHMTLEPTRESLSRAKPGWQPIRRRLYHRRG